MSVMIRNYRPKDLERLKQLTIASFEGVTLEQNVEQSLGTLHGKGWQWRKEKHIEEDVAAHPSGIFVAETDGVIVGYISTRIDPESGKGRIPNLAVDAAMRGQGLGRQLIERALDYFREQGMSYAMIETMAQNEIGQYLYPSCGFQEVARQVHYARRL
jgi:ribosomal protein S18 acetylase RimI-like enzyme